MSGSDRRRLVRFCMLRQHLCPLCGSHICFDNKDNVYKCKNEDCSYIVEKENNSTSSNGNNINTLKPNNKTIEETQELNSTTI